MREYLIRVVGAALVAALGEMFLPEGSVKKYAGIILGLFVCAALLPTAVRDIDISLFTTEMPLAAEDTFDEEVRKEYKARVEALIFENTGIVAKAYINEDYTVKSIVLEKEPPPTGMSFIINNLGVDRGGIKIREN